jgi:hypothetical protein
MQVVSPAGDLLMLLTLATVLALAIGSAVQLARRRGRSAALLAGAAGVIVAAYGAALVGVGLASRPVELPAGAAKCFDDWCAAMEQARPARDQGRLLVDVQLQNRGRGRAMRSTLTRAYLTLDGGTTVAPRNGEVLRTTLLQPGESRDVELVFDLPPGLHGTRFVVVENDGGPGPGTITIGGEGSPFHGQAGWPLAPAGGSGRG